MGIEMGQEVGEGEPTLSNTPNHIVKEGWVVMQEGVSQEDNLFVYDGKETGREEGSGGLSLSVGPNNWLKGGEGRRKSKSADLDQAHKSNPLYEAEGGNKKVRHRGVYSDGPSVAFQ
ncbi:hypothetical protein A2U01_0009282, partial [Trifolium medium]|nr:hypothetical protein [Trifolium medium]